MAAWPEVEDVAADGGTGLARGLDLAAEARQQAVQPTPEAAPAKATKGRDFEPISSH